MHLMISKSALIVLLLKTPGISKFQNFIKPQIKNQNLFSLKCSQGQEIFHAKQNLYRQCDLHKLGKSKVNSAGILF